MEDYNKIIESLGVRFIKTKNIRIVRSFTVENFYDVENLFILLHKGNLFYGEEKNIVCPKEFLFIPAGKSVEITFGNLDSTRINNDEFLSNKERYFIESSTSETVYNEPICFTYVTFDAKVFDSVNFFNSLDITPFVLQDASVLTTAMAELTREELGKSAGKERMIKLQTERIAIEIMRYILDNHLFVEQLATNVTYFKDPRLIGIFAYIKNNLEGDLSNIVLASVANVSEDYVGQYFKMLTGINPQDYIEYQRMEKAVHLLRTTKESIRDIGRDVGYKDTAYFCRRFKMMFGIPAGKMRRRETVMEL